MPRLLITEDSAVIAMLLRFIFEQEEDFEVVGIARNGEDAVRMATSLQPDVITMDIRMPRMDGFEATRQIMASYPVPIVVISGHVDDEELRITFRAIEEGALCVIDKPPGVEHPDFPRQRRELVETVRAMADVRVIRRRSARKNNEQPVPSQIDSSRRTELIAIGASTGGPSALAAIFKDLPAPLTIPIVITQHMSAGFMSGLIQWLGSLGKHGMMIAEHGMALTPGHVYFAPDNRHLTFIRVADRLIVHLDERLPINGFRPSIDAMLESVAQCCGPRATGLLLTGMGSDGAQGMLALRQAGGLTWAQDFTSCVVDSMPASAVSLGAICEIIALENIGSKLATAISG